ncbi:hypothetical protein [Dysgonomonas sp. ZJ279]|uniref:hypothetical protein n=1 Tax=Dysgonomonas sp. ZJ279 TaxID=2709796 RepID=UPI0013EE0A11|nr:hypothetical protein [Dysgonomonas sp. ZJ279]
MSYRLVQNIKHTDAYNSGGITSLHLLDIKGFEHYIYKDDKQFDECFVDSIVVSLPYSRLDTVHESNFAETHENGVYKQTLTTFVRTLEGTKLSNILLASVNKYLVVFKTSQGKGYTFGSDGGASLSFTQQTGQLGEAAGYTITIGKNSVYPLFEIDADKFDSDVEWILEHGWWNDRGVWMRNGIWQTTNS